MLVTWPQLQGAYCFQWPWIWTRPVSSQLKDVPCSFNFPRPFCSFFLQYNLFSYLASFFAFYFFLYRFLFLVPRRGGNCSRVVEPKYCSTDLHYSQTFVPEKDQSSITVLQSIKDSKCSPVFEKYLCYTTVPPCKPNDLSVYVPCRSICEQVG